ncbi:hypothetical protein M127_1892 [Bacteroides fragilis str. S6L5]|nr:hypothetical protein M130_1910 [Bacteroides fragilis str. S6R6]EYE51548.1 hypothetical protein M127_1892 [Bacteroides fragilis str. S6L5]
MTLSIYLVLQSDKKCLPLHTDKKTPDRLMGNRELTLYNIVL